MRDWPTLPPIPAPGVAVFRTDGTMQVDWYRYFAALDPVIRAVTVLGLNDLADVEVDAPADGEVLTYVDADGTWQPV